MNIAIYSRKSKFTETGESIQNQISMCKAYADAHFKDCTFAIYEDEGFSGGNIDRPMFKKLIHDAESHCFDILMCYRLDRISRNVADFSETLELLARNNISFVSLKEQFDTSTPMGRAMIYIASVFAQLERDTIAERITDNFTELAKTGRFLAGAVPEGLRAQKLHTPDGKQYNILETVPGEAEKISAIYQKYIELGSITKLVRYCARENIRTKKGTAIQPGWLSRVLQHPLYAVADQITYEYFRSKGARITCPASAFDGRRGLIVYRRTKQKGPRHMAANEPENWMVSVGQHQGLIPSRDWVNVQHIIAGRSHYGEKMRRTTGGHGLFTGMLRCGKCGGYMRPVGIRPGRFYYKCVTKEKTRKALCDVKDIRGDIFDRHVLAEVQHMLSDPGALKKELYQLQALFSGRQESNQSKIKNLQKAIGTKQAVIKSLIQKLSTVRNETLEKHIAVQVEALDKEIQGYQKELAEINARGGYISAGPAPGDMIADAVSKISSGGFESTDALQVKRNLLKTIIQNIMWDGADSTVHFYSAE